MANEEIQSPPYPGPGTTAVALYHYLRNLRAWVVYYRNQLNEASEQEIVPKVITFPKVDAYLSQPVSTQYLHLVMIRTMREQWDGLIRDYEDSWDCKKCVSAKVVLIQHAIIMLNGAFTSHEVREMHAQNANERIQRVMEKEYERLRRELEKLHQDDKDDEDQTSLRGPS